MWSVPVGFPDAQTRWYALCARAGGRDGFETLLEEIVDRYAEPHRAYHNLAHIAHCLAECDRFEGSVQVGAKSFDAVRMALWFHDLAYDVKAKDNEEQSAIYARTVLGLCGFDALFIADVARLVRSTSRKSQPKARDEMFMVDVDLAILGADTSRFEEYERQIRREYAHVPEDVFANARKGILERFLDTKVRRSIYCTHQVRGAYEDAARANLARSIGRLAQGIVLS